MRFPGFIGPSYVLQSLNVDAQRCVNLFPEINTLGTGKAREVASLVPTPGLTRLLTLVSEGTGTAAPVRGLYTASNGNVYAVADNEVFQISSAFVASATGIAVQSRTGPVSMADNGTDLIIVDGTNAYHRLLSATGESGTIITDEDFLGADQVAFLDGYLIFNKPGSQQFFYTDLNAVTFDALDIQSAEALPDEIVGIRVYNQNLYVFGTQTIEVFYNSGDADQPFQRIQGAVIDTGLGAVFSIRKAADSLFFLGGDENGSGIIYQMQGYQPRRVSTPSVEAAIRARTADQISRATAWTYQQGGHEFYCLNIEGTNTTWCYDISTGMWHERQYLGLWGLERHRAECHTVAFGKNIVGDYQTGEIYELDPTAYTDDGDEIVRLRAAPHFSDGEKFIRHNSFQLDMETGVGLDGTAQGTDPKVMLQYSDDGGHTWSNELWRDIGKIGERKTRVVWRRLGMSRDRVYRVQISDPVKVVLIGAELDVEKGVA